MNHHDLTDDTIVAIATPPGEGGIGVLRLSGPKAPEVLGRIWRGSRPVSSLVSHKLYLGKILDPKSGEELDEGLVVWMRAPHSYTAEEVVEIQAHGGPLVLNKILNVFVGQGLRLAEPGEFTRRAYLNGKMDLLQAEAVGELIHAQSEAALKNARGQLAGRISGEVESLREKLLGLLARVEAAIDFPEEDIEILAAGETLAELASLAGTLEGWLKKFDLGRLLREGVRLALVGRPNVGKSSLLNRLMGEERAIVHHRPGTTRDVIEASLNIGGVLFQIFDTAGIRKGEAEVEVEGIKRSKKTLAQADLILWILDVSVPLTEEDREIFMDRGSRVLVVANKGDLGVQVHHWPEAWDQGKGLLPGEWRLISAKTGEGVEELKEAILREVGLKNLGDKAEAYLNNTRHREALTRSLVSLARGQAALKEGMPPECVAADLREATLALEALLGKISAEDVLDKIFAEFCLGK